MRRIGKRIGIGALVLVWLVELVRSAMRIPPRWHAWQTGVPDFYPGEHRGLFFSAVTLLLLWLVVPIPLVARVKGISRATRFSLWGAWAVLMSGIVFTLAQE